MLNAPTNRRPHPANSPTCPGRVAAAISPKRKADPSNPGNERPHSFTSSLIHFFTAWSSVHGPLFTVHCPLFTVHCSLCTVLQNVVHSQQCKGDGRFLFRMQKCPCHHQCSKKWAAKINFAAALSLGFLERTAMLRITAKAWSLPSPPCWPGRAPQCPSGSKSRTSTCSTSPKRSPSPESHSAPIPRSPAACSSPG